MYGISGLCCGIAAIMVVARTTSGASTNGLFYELDAIAAVVIGGTLLSGGRGSLLGTLVGVLIFTVLNSIFTQNNLDTDIQNIAKGAIIVVAVLLQTCPATQGQGQGHLPAPCGPAGAFPRPGNRNQWSNHEQNDPRAPWLPVIRRGTGRDSGTGGMYLQ